MPEERKLVTILFADVTGSTALGESLDPEDVRALMGRYYTHARRLIPEHGGTLEKFIGDAVMAVFGLPRAHSNDAERALAAALALREAVEQDSVLAGRLQLRMGVNTGEVVATSDVDSGDFLVTGDAVNIAARLQQGANPGEIVASERTALATQAAFLFAGSRQVEVKGKREPLRVFPLLAAQASRQVDRPPLVGRKPDLLQLSVLQMRVWEERRPQLVSIVAPAGTGKTRLLEEFLARLDAAEGFRVATARCLPYGQSLTYWPLRGLLSGLVGSEMEQPELTKAQLVGALSGGGLRPEDAAHLADLILLTLGMEQEGAADRESLFAAWQLLVEACAKQAPLILVFEDLHWASESLLDLVEHVMHPRGPVPLLIIVLSRPELLDRRPLWGGGRRNFTALALEPLSDAQTRELVDRLMEGAPQGIRERVVERAGGNPFFTIELVRVLAGQGRSGQAATADLLPDTVHAAVLAQLDLLSLTERTVAQAAAVAGRSFRPATLQAALPDLERRQLETALDGLLTRNLVLPAESGVFTFRHALIRDVAYGTLARAERVRLHGRIAAWLEDYAAGRLDEFIELIAYHYRQAVRLSRQAAVPLELPLDPVRAVGHLRRAGELASRACAFAEARAYLQSALELAPEEEYVALYEELGDRCAYFGETAVESYRKAYEYWRGTPGGDPLVGARLQRKLASVYYLQGAWGRSVVARRKSADAFNACNLPAEAATERLEASAHLHGAGYYTEALQLLPAILADAEQAARHDLLARALGLKGALHAKLGDIISGLEETQKGLSIALDHSLIGPAAEVYQRLAGVYEQAADYPEAKEAYHNAVTYCEQQGVSTMEQVCIACMVVVLHQTGEWDEGVALSQSVMNSAKAAPIAKLIASSILGLILACKGQLREARRLLNDSLAGARASEMFGLEILCTWGMAMVSEAEADTQSALGYCHTLLEHWEQTEERHYVIPPLRWAATLFGRMKDGKAIAACATGLSRIASATSNREALAGLAHTLGEAALANDETQQAIDHFHHSLALLATIEAPFEYTQTQMQYGMALLRVGRGEEGIHQLIEAHRTARKMGARPLAARISAALAERGEHVHERLGARATGEHKRGGLTQRQYEIVRLIAEGLTNTEIAARLTLSIRTVDMHVSNLLTRLDCRSRAEAVRRAAELNLLEGKYRTSTEKIP